MPYKDWLILAGLGNKLCDDLGIISDFNLSRKRRRSTVTGEIHRYNPEPIGKRLLVIPEGRIFTRAVDKYHWCTGTDFVIGNVGTL